jgi:hypothetical protein
VSIGYTEVDIITARTLTRASTKRATIDLSASNVFGATLKLSVGRSGTTVMSSGVDILVRSLYGSTIRHLDPVLAVRTAVGTTVARTQINNGAGYAVGTTAITVDSGTNFVAQDQLCFWGTATDPTGLGNDATQANLEFARLAATAGSILTLDAGVLIAKIDNEYVTDQAEHYTCWCPGGAVYEIIFDYSDDAAGELVAIRAVAVKQTLT